MSLSIAYYRFGGWRRARMLGPKAPAPLAVEPAPAALVAVPVEAADEFRNS
jgi:hypothetical protein